MRRRAYGPDADIDADPVAQARLAELEREYAQRGRAADRTPTDRDAATGEAVSMSSPVTRPEDHRDADGSRAPADPSATAVVVPGQSDTAGLGGMRRALPLIAIGASVVAVIALGVLGFERLSRPQPAARLQELTEVPRGTALPVVDSDVLRFWGVTEPVFVSYGEYGALDAWRMSGSPGRQCVVVSVGGDVAGLHCTAPGIDTIVDILSVNSWMPAVSDGGRIPLDSTVRFVLHDDVIDVFVGRIDKTTD